MQILAEAQRRQGRTIGFVPTMGFLHEGHLTLMRSAREQCDTVVASIFVNPTQFGPDEDYERYPRDEVGDRRKCESVCVDILFIPTAIEMYHSPSAVYVIVEGVSDILEGKIRPGHFRGVATVVAKLLQIVKPHRAYFGQKDYQQCIVIKRMVSGINMDVEVNILPIVRERDGLALSSRNSYLNANERRAAPAIYRALSAAEQLVRSGEKESEKLKSAVRAVLEMEPLIAIDYVEIADHESLEPLVIINDLAVILIAVHLGRTRLIDNLLLV